MLLGKLTHNHAKFLSSGFIVSTLNQYGYNSKNKTESFVNLLNYWIDILSVNLCMDLLSHSFHRCLLKPVSQPWPNAKSTSELSKLNCKSNISTDSHLSPCHILHLCFLRLSWQRLASQKSRKISKLAKSAKGSQKTSKIAKKMSRKAKKHV